MRIGLLSLFCVLASALLAGCGEGSHSSSSTAASTRSSAHAASRPTTATTTQTATTAEPKSLAAEPRSQAVIKYGHPGKTSEKAALAATVKTYYAALVADRREVLCGLLSKSLLSQLRRELAEPAPGSAAALLPANKTFYKMSCSDLLTHVIRPPSPSRPKLPPSTLTEIRVYRDHGYAILRNDRNGHLKELSIQREHGLWKIDSLLAMRIS